MLSIHNPNSRRSAALAIRSVLGIKVHAPTGKPKRYDLPDEDTLRFALMFCKYETRALLMAYGGLRLGEACAVTGAQLEEDRLNGLPARLPALSQTLDQTRNAQLL